MSEPNGNGNGNGRVGTYVTNKWLVGTLALLVISMGSYIFNIKDKGSDAQASQIVNIQNHLNAHDIEISTINTAIDLKFGEVIRRLEKIEGKLEGGGVYRRQAFNPPATPPHVMPLGVWPNCKPTQDSIQAGNGEWFCRDRR